MAFVNPFAPRRASISDERREALRAAVRAHGDCDGATITLSELACRDQGCAEVETVILITEAKRQSRALRLHKRLSEVTETCIREAIDAGGLRTLE
ncbi:nitrate reductase [Oryzibacter oryziterrae]|uniref:nitrate reductase n=1 Tax=Oryzibacter oryziterrae TaxID=2766474 RepID=UPI001F22C651|nr:nitrate reductase [Oryzibacter oryziterrae]